MKKPDDTPYQSMAEQFLTDDGSEKVSSVPMSIPSGFKRPDTLAEQVARLVRSHEFNRRMAEQGAETFEDADDFDVDDDFDPSTPFEMHFDPILGREVSAKQFLDNTQHYAKAYKEAARDIDDDVINRDTFVKRLKRSWAAKKSAAPPPVAPSPKVPDAPPNT